MRTSVMSRLPPGWITSIRSPTAKRFLTSTLAQQSDVEWPSGHRVVGRLAVDLGRARRVVQRLGAALDLERGDADLDQPLDVLDRAQVLGIHDVGAVLVFRDGHKLARPFGFLDQVGL